MSTPNSRGRCRHGVPIYGSGRTEGGVHDAYGRGDDLGDVSKGLQIQHTQAGIAGRFTVKYLQNEANILVKHCGLPLCRVHLAVS